MASFFVVYSYAARSQINKPFWCGPTHCLFIGQRTGKLSSVEVTCLAGLLSKHGNPVPVTLTKTRQTPLRSLAVIWYIEEAFHITRRPCLTSVYLVNLGSVNIQITLSAPTYCIAAHFQSGQRPALSVLPGSNGIVLTCPNKPNKKEQMLLDAYKLLQTRVT